MTPVAKTGLHCGNVPNLQQRFPLGVTPVAKTGLHCGKKLRPSMWDEFVRVTPVAKTGLHCGIWETPEGRIGFAG